jgi:hypothetical protein
MGRNKLKKCNIVTFFRSQTLCRNWIYIFLLIIYFIYNILRAKTTVIRTFIVSKIIEYHEMDNKRTCKSRSVATHPGSTELTKMPVPESSAARIRVNAFTAALETLYAGGVPAPI